LLDDLVRTLLREEVAAVRERVCFDMFSDEADALARRVSALDVTDLGISAVEAGDDR
jgi:hypothetical protein